MEYAFRLIRYPYMAATGSGVLEGSCCGRVTVDLRNAGKWTTHKSKGDRQGIWAEKRTVRGVEGEPLPLSVCDKSSVLGHVKFT